jgi:hypothetical protein
VDGAEYPDTALEVPNLLEYQDDRVLAFDHS